MTTLEADNAVDGSQCPSEVEVICSMTRIGNPVSEGKHMLRAVCSRGLICWHMSPYRYTRLRIERKLIRRPSTIRHRVASSFPRTFSRRSIALVGQDAERFMVQRMANKTKDSRVDSRAGWES